MYAPNRFISVSTLILRTSIWINYKSGAAILLNIFYAHRQPKKFYNNFIFMFIDRKDKLAYRSKWQKWNTHDTLQLRESWDHDSPRVTGNHACFISVILICISLYTHVYRALSNSICCKWLRIYESHISIYIYHISYLNHLFITSRVYLEPIS